MYSTEYFMLRYNSMASQLQRVLDYAAYRWDKDGICDVVMKKLSKANLSGIVTVQSIHSDIPKIINGETKIGGFVVIIPAKDALPYVF